MGPKVYKKDNKQDLANKNESMKFYTHNGPRKVQT